MHVTLGPVYTCAYECSILGNMFGVALLVLLIVWCSKLNVNPIPSYMIESDKNIAIFPNSEMVKNVDHIADIDFVPIV